MFYFYSNYMHVFINYKSVYIFNESLNIKRYINDKKN